VTAGGVGPFRIGELEEGRAGELELPGTTVEDSVEDQDDRVMTTD